MAERAHHQQLGKFVALFQALENSLIEFTSATADEDYAAEILPAETEYPRLVESTGLVFSGFIDRLLEPDLAAKLRFHRLMEECLDIGALRNRLVGSAYALLVRTGDAVEPAQDEAGRKFDGGPGRHASGEDLPVEPFEPYFQRIAEAIAEVESFRLQVIERKHSDAHRNRNGRLQNH